MIASDMSGNTVKISNAMALQIALKPGVAEQIARLGSNNWCVSGPAQMVYLSRNCLYGTVALTTLASLAASYLGNPSIAVGTAVAGSSLAALFGKKLYDNTKLLQAILS